MKIAFVHWSGKPWIKEELFNTKSTHIAAYYSIPHFALKRKLSLRGIYLDGYESFSSSNRADALICVDLPSKTSDLDNFINSYIRDGSPRFLIVSESAHSKPEFLSRRTFNCWDHVFHYSHLINDSQTLTRYTLPSNLPFLKYTGSNYSQASKKLVGMMATNKPSRRSNPNCWWITKAANGYFLSPSDLRLWLQLKDGIRFRRFWAFNLAKLIPNDFLIFGKGWSGGSYAPIHRFIKPKPNICAVSSLYDWSNPISIITHFRFFFAIENLIGDPGYFTEKVFNVIRAGSVPICMTTCSLKCPLRNAAERFGQFYIDLNNYKTPTQLVDHLSNINEAEYLSMQEAGRLFLASEFSHSHTLKYYAESMASQLANLLE